MGESMAISKREFRQAVRRCQELGVAIDMLPLPDYHNKTSAGLEKTLVHAECRICHKHTFVNLFGECCDCAA